MLQKFAVTIEINFRQTKTSDSEEKIHIKLSFHAKRKQERDYCIQYNKKKHDDNIDKIRFEMILSMNQEDKI